MDLALNGRVALVTGAARDVGREIARTLAAEGAAIAVNYLSSASEAEAVVAEIKAQGGSAKTYQADVSDFAAARAGVVALMKSLAREFGGSGMTANTVSLGLVETAHDRAWVEENREKLTRLYPVRRLGLPDDIAPAVALLASPRSGWITGQTLCISGGFSMV